jgi:RNA polymerase sigma-70 factor, ECF subfamily
MQATVNNRVQELLAAPSLRLIAERPHGLYSGMCPGSQLAPSNVVLPPSLAASGTVSEREAIRLAQNGNQAGFEYLYQLHSRRVYGLCLRMLRSPTDAEDLTQEVFLLVFRKFHTFRGESAFSTWLHRLAVNLVLMHLRRKCPPSVAIEASPESEDDGGFPSTEIGAPDLSLQGSVDRIHLERCIARLPSGCRLVFVLYDIQGYQHSEIAEIIGRSVGDSKSQLHKARKRLRELLHEIQRERMRDDRMTAAKMRSRCPGVRRETLGSYSDSTP